MNKIVVIGENTYLKVPLSGTLRRSLEASIPAECRYWSQGEKCIVVHSAYLRTANMLCQMAGERAETVICRNDEELNAALDQ